MADQISNDGIKTVTGSMESLNTSTQGVSDSLEGLLNMGSRIDAKLTKPLSRVSRVLGGLKSAVTPGIKQFEKLDDIASNTEKSLTKLGSTYAKALYAGNKEVMTATNAIQKNGKSMLAASAAAADWNRKLTESSERFRTFVNRLSDATVVLDEAKLAQDKHRKALEDTNLGKASVGYKLLEANLADATAQVLKHTAAVKSANAAAEEEAITSIALTQNREKETKEMIRLNKCLIEDAAEARKTNREMRKMAGGVTAVTASIEDLTDSKMFEFIGKLGTLSIVTMGLTLLNKHLSQTSDYMNATNRAAISLGDTAKGTGTTLGRSFSDDAQNAGKELSLVRNVALDLGYEMEDLQGTMNKVRSGIKMDREGRLSSEAIRDMTKEAAIFSRVSGLELSDSVALMETRVKRFGMTAKEAVADMQAMRGAILEMTAGNKGNTIAMDDMVKIIDEASAASQSYIVDTRIMTQALRGAVNQAEHLGVAQAQAKDVAKATGKILSNAPDYIKIPAGFDLVNQLIGKDGDDFIKTLDEGTQKQVRAIKKSLDDKTTGHYAGAKILMDLIGQTEAGIAAQSKHLERTLLGSGQNAALLIQQEYGIENAATADMITRMMRDTIDARKKLGADVVPASTLMVKNAVEFDEAIKGAVKEGKSATDILTQKGLSTKDAAAYFDAYKKGAGEQKALEEKLAAGGFKDAQERLDLEKKIYMAKIGARTMILEDSANPMSKMLREFNSLSKGKTAPLAFKADWSQQDFEKMGIDSGKKLAEYMGINYDDNKQAMDKAFQGEKETGKTTAAHLKDLKALSNKANAEAAKMAEVYKSPIQTLKWGMGKLGAMYDALSPLAKWMASAAIVFLGIRLIMMGQRNVLNKTVGMVDNHFKKLPNKIARAIKGGGGYGGGSDYDGKNKNGKGNKGGWNKRIKNAGRFKGVKGFPRKNTGKGFAGKSMGGLRRLKLPAMAGGILAAGFTAKDIYDKYEEGGSAKDMAKVGASSGGRAGGAIAGGAAGAAMGSVVPIVGTIIGGLIGAAIGSQLGGVVGDAVADSSFLQETPSNALPNTVATAGKPTTMPETAKPAVAQRGAAGMSSGGPQGQNSLAANAGRNSITPDGALTLKIHGFKDVIGQDRQDRLSYC